MFVKSWALRKWVSQCSVGKNGCWFTHINQNGEYETQVVKWLEATQAPKVQISTNTYRKTLMSASGNWASQVTKHRAKTLRIVVPMATPQQIKLAGYVKTSSNIEPTDITSTLISNSRTVYDGMNTIYEFDWPLDYKRQENLRYLELMVEVTSQYGNKLFAKQGGARFTLDLDNPAPNDNKDWYKVDLLEENDVQSVSRNKMISSLKILATKFESTNE